MAKWVVPVELETGVPLGIAPSERGLVPAGLMDSGADWNHLLQPSDRKEFETPLGNALRNSVVEWMNVDEHDALHYQIDDYMRSEWQLPHTEPEQFGMMIIIVAGYLPENFIKIEKNGLSYVQPTDHQRQKMRDDGILRIRHEGIVRNQIWQKLENQNLKDKVREDDIEQFLTTTDGEERVRLGNKLLGAAALMATQDIRPIYMAAYKKRLMLPTVPKQPHRFITDHPIMWGKSNSRRKARKALHARLANEYELDLADTA